MDDSLLNEGFKSYAYKQADTWSRLESNAVEAFESSLYNRDTICIQESKEYKRIVLLRYDNILG